MYVERAPFYNTVQNHNPPTAVYQGEEQMIFHIHQIMWLNYFSDCII